VPGSRDATSSSQSNCQARRAHSPRPRTVGHHEFDHGAQGVRLVHSKASTRRPVGGDGTESRPALWHIVCVAIGLVLLYPVLWLLTASVKSGTEIISNLSPVPKVFTPGNYGDALDGRRALEEAAIIDGCGPYRTFWHIIMPLLKPALVTTRIFSFIWSRNDFLPQLMYPADPDTYTLQLGLTMFVDQSGSAAFGPMFAMSVLTLVPIVLFFLAFQRLLVEGVQTSGRKG
jgi:ABC-type glycerol-3-phosphate transport system permease component